MKGTKKYISPILTTIILILFTIYLYTNPQIIDGLISVKTIYILLIMGLYLLIFFVEGVFIQVTLDIFKKKVDTKESFFLATISRIGNYLLPMRAGAVFRAAYLKKKFNFDYSNFLSTLYGYYIIFFLTNSVLALLILLIKWFIQDQQYMLLITFFFAISIGMLLLVFIKFPLDRYIEKSKGITKRILTFISKFLKGWDLIVKNKRAFLLLILLAFANIFINILVVVSEFLAININGDILDSILYTCISGVSLLISITPGSLGIREAVFLITSGSLGLNSDQVIQLAFLDRGIMFVLLLVALFVILIFFKRYNLKELFFSEKREVK